MAPKGKGKDKGKGKGKGCGHLHRGEVCDHAQLAYCAKCDAVYCLRCSRQWPAYQWYTVSTGATIGTNTVTSTGASVAQTFGMDSTIAQQISDAYERGMLNGDNHAQDI